MAKHTITTLVDDVDGSTLDIQTYRFSWDGQDYEIDLGPKSSKKLVETMERYIDSAQKLTKRGATQTRTKVSAGAGSSKEQLGQIREWAKANGHQVSERGRISQTVRDAYDAAH